MQEYFIAGRGAVTGRFVAGRRIWHRRAMAAAMRAVRAATQAMCCDSVTGGRSKTVSALAGGNKSRDRCTKESAGLARFRRAGRLARWYWWIEARARPLLAVAACGLALGAPGSAQQSHPNRRTRPNAPLCDADRGSNGPTWMPRTRALPIPSRSGRNPELAEIEPEQAIVSIDDSVAARRYAVRLEGLGTPATRRC